MQKETTSAEPTEIVAMVASAAKASALEGPATAPASLPEPGSPAVEGLSAAAEMAAYACSRGITTIERSTVSSTLSIAA